MSATKEFFFACDACGVFEPMLPSMQGSFGDCKSCDSFLGAAPANLRLPMIRGPEGTGSLDDLRGRIAIVLINRQRALECVNFCLSSLDRSSIACSSHERYDAAHAMKELYRYQKRDLDPMSAPPVNIQPHPHSDLLFSLALGSFLLFGDCTFTTECLRRCHLSNPLMYTMLSGNGFTISKEEHERVKHQIQEGHWYYKRYKTIWNRPGVKEWLMSLKEEVKRKSCDAVACGKVEDKVGMWKVCKGCSVWFYCGVECQSRDWKEGGHKKSCKETRQWVARMRAELEAGRAREAAINASRS